MRMNAGMMSVVGLLAVMMCAGTADALTFDANVTPDVIFGSGNSNGYFTVDQGGGVELGIRAKIPYTGVIHSNGDGTYSYTLAELLAADPSQRWNFDWTVNTDFPGSSGMKIDDFTYRLGIDFDPSQGTDFLEFDPITPNAPPLNAAFFDHSIGDNFTLNGAGTEAADSATYAGLIANNNVCQQSWRHAFFPIHPTLTYDPTIDGTYDIYLNAYDGANNLVASTTIQVIIGAGGAPVTVYVDDDWNSQADVDLYDPNLTWQFDAFNVIQDGIDAVAGSTVNILAGTYVEQLYIDKSVDLVGAGCGSTVIQAVPLVSRTTFDITQWNSSVRTVDACIGVNDAGTVNISGITVDGLDLGANNFYGIFLFNTSGSVTNSCIENVTYSAAPGTQRVVSLAATHGVASTIDIDFSGNTIPEFQKGGILIMGPGATFTVDSNTVSTIPSSAIAGNGIQLSYGASGTTSGNVVEGVGFTGSDWAGTGILLFESGDIAMTGDEVFNCESGVNFSDWGWVYNNPSPVNLTFTDLNLHGNTWTLGAQLSRDNSDPNITIAGCDILASAGDGIDVWGSGIDPWGGGYYTGWNNGNLSVDISGCNINGAALDGIWTADLSGNANTVSAFDVSDCSFSGNAGSAINNQFPTQMINASGCWWGDGTGPVQGTPFAGGRRSIAPLVQPFGEDLPSHAGSRPRVDANTSTLLVGETILGSVDYTPWMGNDGTYNMPGFSGDFSVLSVDDDSPQSGAASRIQEGIDLVSGSTVNVAAGTYPGNIVATKAVDLVGAGAGSTTLAGAGGSAVTLNSDSVTISGFTITNPTGSSAIYAADRSTIAIRDNVLTSVGNGTAGLAIHAITIVSSASPVADVTIERNEISNITGGANKSVSAISVGWSSGSEPITGLLIQDNSISHVLGDTSAWPVGHGAYGILINHGTGVTGRTVAPQILNNVIDDLDGLWSHGIGLEGNTPDALVQGNVIGNLLDHKTPSDAAAIQVEDNASAASVLIRTNSFTNLGPSGTDGYGIRNVTGILVDARSNWWGDPSGPLHPLANPSGLGVGVTDDVLFDPWYTGNIIIVPDPETLTMTNPTKTVSVDYLGGGGGLMYGYNISFSWDGAAVTTSAAQVIEGDLLSDQGSAQFFKQQGGNSITVNAALLGAQPGVTGPGTLFTIAFTGLACDTSVIDVTINAVRDNSNQPLGGFFEDDGLLYVDPGLPTITVSNPWPDSLCQASAPSLDLSADAVCGDLDDAFYNYDGGGWQSDAGLFTNLAGSTWLNAAWTLPGFGALSEGTHTVNLYCTDDFGNVSAAVSWDFIKDTTPPSPVSGFTATTGNGKTHLSWTNPGGDFDHVVVVRKAWSAASPFSYPDYYSLPALQAAAGYPANPADGTVVYSGTAEAFVDSLTDRSIYFYHAFAHDCAGNWTGGTLPTGNIPAAFAQGDRTTNYWLGDVTGSDGLVWVGDISTLSATYWQTEGGGSWDNSCDVGPTDDFSRTGLPLPDDVVDFEDLIIFAMNYGVVGPAGKRTPQVILAGKTEAASPTLRLEGSLDDEGFFTASLILDGNVDEVKGASVEVLFDENTLEFVGARPSDALAGGGSFFMGDRVSRGDARVDLSALGMERTIHGSGEIAVLTFRAAGTGDHIDLRFGDVRLRGVGNEDLTVTVTGLALSNGGTVPSVTRLVGAVPNPFNPTTAIHFELSASQHVTIGIYDVGGRLVRNLVDEQRPAGRYADSWDGRDNDGRASGSGVYLLRMEAGTYSRTARVVLLK